MSLRKGSILFLIARALLAAQAPVDATFHTTTKLVQVSVVAQDKDGKPVSDLRREDFQILDNGELRDIRLFLAENGQAPRPKPPAPGTFTNGIATAEGARSGYSVILFDNLNTGFEPTARARLKGIEALKAIPAGDKIAMYSLWCNFQVIREFTTDRDSLLHQLERFYPAAGAVCAGSAPEEEAAPLNRAPSMADLVDPGGAIARSRATADAARIAALQAGTITDQEMIMIADHLAGIPGRKNLIWIAQKFPLSPVALQRLVNAGVVLYPVDAIGSTIAIESEKEAHAAPILALARRTGGIAYVDRDDFDVAIRESLEDGRISYTLGFYASDEPSPDPKAKRGGAKQPPPHQLSIRVSRPGIALRYRTSYRVEPSPPVSANPVGELVQALNRPVDATAIGLTASATRRQDRLDLTLSFDLASLDLTQAGGVWKGAAEVVARFMTPEGVWAGEVISQTVTFNLKPQNFASMLRSGATYHRELKIPAKAVELKLLVGQVASGKIGTLTIPLAEVEGGAAPPK
ncbi:MAG TPA: VWA domain-containing protein [Bryobacteraceae bacterium]|jgi:VWFA-related protein